MKISSLPLWLVLVFPILFSSCSTAKTAQPSGFLKDYSSLREGTYFKQEQIDTKIDYALFKRIKVAPVDVSFLNDKTACSSEELEGLAADFRQDVEEQLKGAGFIITSVPTDSTLVIQLAITDIETPDIAFNAGMSAASFMAPVPLPFDKNGKTSFEGKITRSTTGNVLIQFAEERGGAGDRLNLKGMTVGKYQRFTNTKTVFSSWAKTIAKMLKDLSQKKGPASSVSS